MTLPPPALAQMPQFTEAYWQKAPREMNKAKFSRITSHLTDGEIPYTEFVFANGNAFQRPQNEFNMDIFNLLHVNLEVFVETIQGELVTGLFVPEKGWVFRMTAEDLSRHAREVFTEVQQRQAGAKRELVEFLSDAIVKGLELQGPVESFNNGGDDYMISAPFAFTPDVLAAYLIEALEGAKR